MRRFTFWQRMNRLMRLRLLVPIKRSVHPPEFTARGVMIGLVWAMTPLVGVQMYFVTMTWLAARFLFRWDFSLIVGLAWTWVTNVVTMFPTYYVFYLTGQVMLGRWDDLSGYAAFVGLFETGWDEHATFIEKFDSFVIMAAKEWGLAMMVGCIPHAALFGWLGYRWSLRVVISHRIRRMKKRFDKAAGHKRDAEALSAEDKTPPPSS
ncbi:MAG: DUF2062 domain-containing protein [Rhodospirillales bacterium]|nr:DUF2062 domain-containing protein [Rhodospirillales bacterium]